MTPGCSAECMVPPKQLQLDPNPLLRPKPGERNDTACPWYWRETCCTSIPPGFGAGEESGRGSEADTRIPRCGTQGGGTKLSDLGSGEFMAEGCEDQLRLWRCRVCSPRWSDYEAGQARFSGRGRFRMCSEFADRLFASCRDEEMTVAGGNCVKIGERWKTPKAFVQNALNVWLSDTSVAVIQVIKAIVNASKSAAFDRLCVCSQNSKDGLYYTVLSCAKSENSTEARMVRAVLKVPGLNEDDFGSHCFGEKTMKRLLSKAVWRQFKKGLTSPKGVDARVADVIASALKDWALSLGATHYTHWFQPLSIAHQAEKHDAFLEIYPGMSEPINGFSGEDLTRGEPDGSSFPSGGLRNTHQARGYTFWDPTSPPFVLEHEDGRGNTLYIPSAFCSWTGEALDSKTPLLRSLQCLSQEVVKLLRLGGDRRTQSVYTTLGCEQEFFLIDRSWALQRPDLLLAGRTVFGAPPSKGQELDDHYFAQMPARVMSCIQDAEAELWKLGVPCKTRHNEVAPSQYGMAPIFESSSVASDHSLLMMNVLERAARRHDLYFLAHEKPFAGVNGSGKHNNWSLATNHGENLLDPGWLPADNARFLLFLTAIIRAVDDHQDLLRASIANIGQEHRLGANEAPPAIISVYLGEDLDQVCRDIMTPAGGSANPERKSRIDLGVTSMPPLRRDRTDRNRTSPFAFTGNKFEFRAVGSSQHVAVPNYVMNTIVANSIRSMREDLGKAMRTGVGFPVARQKVVEETLTRHYRIVFNGDGYSKDWPLEAARRGLLNIPSTPEAIQGFLNAKNIALFEKFKVLQESEISARVKISHEEYAMSARIEGNVTVELARSHVLPAAVEYQTIIARGIAAVKAAGMEVSASQLSELERASANVGELLTRTAELRTLLDDKPAATSDGGLARYMHERVLPAMARVREVADTIELTVDDVTWALPKYREMLFVK